MKRILLASILLLGIPAVLNAAPDPRDSVIVESKIVQPGNGAGYLSVRVFFTNKDTLANVTLPLEQKSTSGAGYAALGYGPNNPTPPREADGAGSFVNLLPSPQLSTLTCDYRYDGLSPDTFLYTATAIPASGGRLVPGQGTAVRRGLADIKFDSVFSGLGQFQLDSARISQNSIQFVDVHANQVEVNFARGVLTVTTSGGCGQFANCPGGGLTVLFGRFLAFDFNSDCEGQPGAVYSVQSGPGGIHSATGVYGFGGACAPGALPVVVRLARPSGGFSDCAFTLNVEDNPPSGAAAQETIIVSHGQPAANQINASDPDPGDLLLFSLLIGPGAVDANGNWTYSTTCADVGLSPQMVRIKTADGFGPCQPGPLADTCQFQLVVTNAAPSVTNCPPDVVRADSNVAFSYQLNAADPDPADGGSPNFSLVSGPAGLSVSPSGLMQWTPSAAQTGLHSAAVRVMDGCNAFSDCQINFAVSVRKGDLNADGILTSADFVLHLNCVFLGLAPTTGASSCDLNCDGIGSSTDVVFMVNAVFLGVLFPC